MALEMSDVHFIVTDKKWSILKKCKGGASVTVLLRGSENMWQAGGVVRWLLTSILLTAGAS